MYSTIYLMSSLRVCGKIEPHWEFVVSSLKRTHWAHCGHTFGYFLKELSMSGSGTLWVHFDQNSQNTCWVIWWAHFEFDLNVPTNHIEIKVVSKFLKKLSTYLLAKVWVNSLKTLNKLTMYLPGMTPSAPSGNGSCTPTRCHCCTSRWTHPSLPSALVKISFFTRDPLPMDRSLGNLKRNT